MNTQKIEYEEQNERSSSDYSFDLPNNSSDECGSQEPMVMGFHFRSQIPISQRSLQLPNRTDSNNTRSSFVGSIASTVYSNENCYYMKFPQYEYGLSNVAISSQLPKNIDQDISANQSSVEQFSVGQLAKQDEFDTLLSVVKRPLHTSRIPKNSTNSEPKNELTGHEDNLERQHWLSPFDEDGEVSCPISTGIRTSSKVRIRWTKDLHEQFVECVNQLGGAEKATPKGILKLMESEGMTILHVKSHLQKYRMAKYMPESRQGKSETEAIFMNNIAPLISKTGTEITEALKLQVDIQRRLHEQIEIQRNLQIQIEEQGKHLKKMFDEQAKKNKSLFDAHFLKLMLAEEYQDSSDLDT